MQIVQMGPLSASRGGRKGSRGPSCHATWNENLPTLGASWKVRGLGWFWGHRLFSCLSTISQLCSSVIYIFIYLKICGVSLWPLIAQCSLQAPSAPQRYAALWNMPRPILVATSLTRPLGRINGQKGCRLQRANCIATAGQTLEGPPMGTDTWKNTKDVAWFFISASHSPEQDLPGLPLWCLSSQRAFCAAELGKIVGVRQEPSQS